MEKRETVSEYELLERVYKVLEDMETSEFLGICNNSLGTNYVLEDIDN